MADGGVSSTVSVLVKLRVLIQWSLIAIVLAFYRLLLKTSVDDDDDDVDGEATLMLTLIFSGH